MNQAMGYAIHSSITQWLSQSRINCCRKGIWHKNGSSDEYGGISNLTVVSSLWLPSLASIVTNKAWNIEELNCHLQDPALLWASVCYSVQGPELSCGLQGTASAVCFCQVFSDICSPGMSRIKGHKCFMLCYCHTVSERRNRATVEKSERDYIWTTAAVFWNWAEAVISISCWYAVTNICC